MKYIMLVLIIGALCMGLDVYTDEPFTVDGTEYRVAVGSGDKSAFVSNEYYSVLLRTGDCENKDIYLWCLNSINRSPVEFYPHEVLVDITNTKQCDGCKAFGQSCTINSTDECSVHCVHGTCRPTETWCGDGVCDENEVCAEDCPIEVVEEEVIEETPVIIEEEEPEAEEGTPQVVEESTEEETTTEEEVTEAVVEEPVENEPAENLVPEEEPDLLDRSIQAIDEGVNPQVNWIGVTATIIFGLVALFIVFTKKFAKNKDPLDQL